MAAALTTASAFSKPRSRSWLENSTISTPFFAAIPISRIIAIWLKMFSDMLNSHKPARAPTMASGTVVMITSGCRKLSNCAARTRNTMASAKPKVVQSWPLERKYSRDSPSKLSRALGGNSSCTSFWKKPTASPRV